MISEFGTIQIGNRKIGRIGIGSGAFFDSFTWGQYDYNKTIETIKLAIDSGIELIDTGESYGKGTSELVIGEAIKGRREKTFIASKISDKTLSHNNVSIYEKACEKSLRRLGVEYLDLYQVHWIDSNMDIDTVVEGMLLLKEKGKVKDIGICNCGKEYSDYFPKDFETNQIPYSLVWRGMEYEFGENLEQCNRKKLFYYCLAQGLLGTNYKKLDLFPKSRKRTRLYDYRILNARHGESGVENALQIFLDKFNLLCNEFNVLQNHAAISWLLQRTEESLAIVGLRNQLQVEEICKLPILENGLIKEIELISDYLKTEIGYKLDLWDSEERIH